MKSKKRMHHIKMFYYFILGIMYIFIGYISSILTGLGLLYLIVKKNNNLTIEDIMTTYVLSSCIFYIIAKVGEYYLEYDG